MTPDFDGLTALFVLAAFGFGASVSGGAYIMGLRGWPLAIAPVSLAALAGLWGLA